ncbi:MAG: PQQ-binding-like beta-propeller repeat protein [Burkholderiales bacterium]|nr:PQQ-binding-like beta-propeller repeat protein [Burkholderiales bacterium]
MKKRWIAAALAVTAAGGVLAADWPSAGANLGNTRYQESEDAITAKTAGNLTLKWSLDTSGHVTAHPAVDGGYLYFPDFAGFLYKVEKATGTVVWKKPISSYTGIAGDFARATPAVAGDALILGNQSGKFLGAALGQPNPSPARVFAVDKHSGDLLWVTQVDATPLSVVTHSAIVANGTAFVGIASNEELVAAFVPKIYWQWQFRGSVVALDVSTGAVKWKTYTVPQGWYGGAVWGSTGSIDLKSNQVFMATGNNYNNDPGAADVADNHFDSIIALDMSTGKVNWGGRGLASDTWNVACGLVAPGFVVAPGPFFPGVYDNCPNGSPATAGPDYDFSQGPMWLGGGLVGAGQKSGRFWAFHHKTGELRWATQVAPGGVTGGLQWGSATDGARIFVAISNSGPSTNGGGVGAMPWTLKDGTTTTAGGWAALDRRTGEVLWTTKDPYGSRSEAPVSATNDVVFGCNMSPSGTMFALNARNGAVLWSHDSGLPCTAGASISDGMVFWGSGTFLFPGPAKMMAFGL